MADDDIHVYPVDDEHPHDLIGTKCQCNPTIEVVGATLIIIHNAFDWREVIEQAKEIINQKLP